MYPTRMTQQGVCTSRRVAHKKRDLWNNATFNPLKLINGTEVSIIEFIPGGLKRKRVGLNCFLSWFIYDILIPRVSKICCISRWTVLFIYHTYFQNSPHHNNYFWNHCAPIHANTLYLLYATFVENMLYCAAWAILIYLAYLQNPTPSQWLFLESRRDFHLGIFPFKTAPRSKWLPKSHHINHQQV